MGLIHLGVLLLFTLTEGAQNEVWTKEYYKEICEHHPHSFKGTVECTLNPKGLIFVPISVNNAKFCPILDTGSSGFWLADANSKVEKWNNPQENFEEQKKYPETTTVTDIETYFLTGLPSYSFPTSSEVSDYVDPRYREVHYGGNTLVNVTLHETDSVTVGSSVFHNVIIGRATEINFATKYRNQPLAVFGLNLLIDEPELSPLPNTNILGAIKNQMPSTMFALKLNPGDPTGTFSLGVPIFSEQTSQAVVVKTEDENWIIRVKKVQVYVHTKWILKWVTILKDQRILIDTGAAGMFFPAQGYQRLRQIFSNVPDKYWGSSNPCSELGILFGSLRLKLITYTGKAVKIDHLIYPTRYNNSDCGLKLYQYQADSDILMAGFPLFKSHYMEFYFKPVSHNYAQKKIAFY